MVPAGSGIGRNALYKSAQAAWSQNPVRQLDTLRGKAPAFRRPDAGKGGTKSLGRVSSVSRRPGSYSAGIGAHCMPLYIRFQPVRDTGIRVVRSALHALRH